MNWPAPQWPILPAFGPPAGLPAPAPRPDQIAAPQAAPEKAPTLSASQVDTYLDCARKWAFKSLWKVFSAPDPSARLGTVIHTIAEDYLTSGKQPDMSYELALPKGRGAPGENVFYPGQIFQAGMHHLPAPGTVHVEGRKKWTTPGLGTPIHWTGALDGIAGRDHVTGYTYHPKAWAPGNSVDALVDRWEVWDHKSTSDLKYQKGPEPVTRYYKGQPEVTIALRDDVQANLYAWATLQEFHVDVVDLRWLYYRTRGRPESRLTAISLTRPEVTEKIAAIDQTAADMLVLYQIKPQIIDLPPTPKTCEKYGGCPYRERCPLTITQRFSMSSPAPVLNASVQALVDQLRAQQATGALPAPGAALPVPQAAPAPQYVPPAPAPVVVPPAGAWSPGQPLNDTQSWMVGQPACTWFALSQAADVPADVAQGQSWDAILLPPNKTGGMPVPLRQAPPAAQAAPSSGAATPSVGGVNPPDAPATMPAQPNEMPGRIALPESMAPAAPANAVAPEAYPTSGDPFAGMERDALKALCVQRGLCTTGSRVRNVDVFKNALRTTTPIADAGETGPAGTPERAPTAQWPQSGPAPQQTIPHTEHAQAAPAPAPAVQAAAAPQPAAAPAYKGGFTLYVYCMPTKGHTSHSRTLRMADLMGALAPQIRQAVGAAHYAMVDFGKGRALFAGLLEEFLAGTNIGPETGIVLERSPEATDALTVLERFAGTVVRGL